MGKQIRKQEIRRRRARKEALKKLRKRYQKAKTTEEKRKIIEKLFKVAPCITESEFINSIKE